MSTPETDWLDLEIDDDPDAITVDDLDRMVREVEEAQRCYDIARRRYDAATQRVEEARRAWEAAKAEYETRLAPLRERLGDLGGDWRAIDEAIRKALVYDARVDTRHNRRMGKWHRKRLRYLRDMGEPGCYVNVSRAGWGITVVLNEADDED